MPIAVPPSPPPRESGAARVVLSARDQFNADLEDCLEGRGRFTAAGAAKAVSKDIRTQPICFVAEQDEHPTLPRGTEESSPNLSAVCNNVLQQVAEMNVKVEQRPQAIVNALKKNFLSSLTAEINLCLPTGGGMPTAQHVIAIFEMLFNKYPDDNTAHSLLNQIQATRLEPGVPVSSYLANLKLLEDRYDQVQPPIDEKAKRSRFVDNVKHSLVHSKTFPRVSEFRKAIGKLTRQAIKPNYEELVNLLEGEEDACAAGSAEGKKHLLFQQERSAVQEEEPPRRRFSPRLAEQKVKGMHFFGHADTSEEVNSGIGVPQTPDFVQREQQNQIMRDERNAFTSSIGQLTRAIEGFIANGPTLQPSGRGRGYGDFEPSRTYGGRNHVGGRGAGVRNGNGQGRETPNHMTGRNNRDFRRPQPYQRGGAFPAHSIAQMYQTYGSEEQYPDSDERYEPDYYPAPAFSSVATDNHDCSCLGVSSLHWVYELEESAVASVSMASCIREEAMVASTATYATPPRLAARPTIAELLPYLAVFLDRFTPAMALLDTGASTNVMKTYLLTVVIRHLEENNQQGRAEELRRQLAQGPQGTEAIQGVTGSRLPAQGEAQLSLTLDGTTSLIKVLCVKDLAQPLILGAPEMKAMGVSLLLVKNAAQMADGRHVPFVTAAQMDTFRQQLREKAQQNRGRSTDNLNGRRQAVGEATVAKILRDPGVLALLRVIAAHDPSSAVLEGLPATDLLYPDPQTLDEAMKWGQWAKVLLVALKDPGVLNEADPTIDTTEQREADGQKKLTFQPYATTFAPGAKKGVAKKLVDLLPISSSTGGKTIPPQMVEDAPVERVVWRFGGESDMFTKLKGDKEGPSKNVHSFGPAYSEDEWAGALAASTGVRWIHIEQFVKDKRADAWMARVFEAVRLLQPAVLTFETFWDWVANPTAPGSTTCDRMHDSWWQHHLLLQETEEPRTKLVRGGFFKVPYERAVLISTRWFDGETDTSRCLTQRDLCNTEGVQRKGRLIVNGLVEDSFPSGVPWTFAVHETSSPSTTQGTFASPPIALFEEPPNANPAYRDYDHVFQCALDNLDKRGVFDRGAQENAASSQHVPESEDLFGCGTGGVQLLCLEKASRTGIKVKYMEQVDPDRQQLAGMQTWRVGTPTTLAPGLYVFEPLTPNKRQAPRGLQYLSKDFQPSFEISLGGSPEIDEWAGTLHYCTAKRGMEDLIFSVQEEEAGTRTPYLTEFLQSAKSHDWPMDLTEEEVQLLRQCFTAAEGSRRKLRTNLLSVQELTQRQRRLTKMAHMLKRNQQGKEIPCQLDLMDYGLLEAYVGGLPLTREEFAQAEAEDPGGLDKVVAMEAQVAGTDGLPEATSTGESYTLKERYILLQNRLGDPHLDHLTPVQRDQLRARIITLSMEGALSYDGELGRTHLVRHRVETGGAKPVRAPLRRLSILELEALYKEVEKLLRLGAIEPSSSPWNSPLMIIPKPHGDGLRVVQDLRAVNRVVRDYGNGQDGYPLPKIDELLQSLGGAAWFSSLDALSGYWHVEVDQDTREPTAFQTRWGAYQWRVAPMGLMNLPSTFQRLMDLAVGRDILWRTALSYIDDILIHSPTFEAHLDDIMKTVRRLLSVGIKLKPAKCHWCQKSVRFLGHIVTAEGIAVDPEKCRAIAKIAPPTDPSEVRSFLQTVGYYRAYIPAFTEMAEPLTNLTRKNVLFEVTDDVLAAMDNLKEALMNAPVLAYPDFARIRSGEYRLELHVDASQTAISAVLSQVSPDGEEHPLGYFARKLKGAEQNYSTYDRECLAVQDGILHFRHLLHCGQEFEVVTDQKAIEWLMTSPLERARQQRMAATLMEYRFVVRHRSGEANGNADGLTRVRWVDGEDCAVPTGSNFHPPVNVTTRRREQSESPRASPTEHPVEEDNPPTGVLPQLKEAQASDEYTENILRELQQPATGPTWKRRGFYDINGILFRAVGTVPSQANDTIVLPLSLQGEALREAHTHPLSGGHSGFRRTYAKLARRYWWPSMYGDTAKFAKACHTCLRRKLQRPRHWTVKDFGEDFLPVSPFEVIGIDVLSLDIATSSGHRVVLVVTDYLTRWAEAFPMTFHTAGNVAELLIERIFAVHGVPRMILSDNGPEFRSQLLASVAELLGIDQRYTSPYHPECNGLTERTNRSLLDQLSVFCTRRKHDWDRYLPLIMSAHRASINDTTGYSPYSMLYGREPAFPFQVTLSKQLELPARWNHVQEYIDDLTERLDYAHEHLRDTWAKIMEARRRTAPDIRTPVYAVGDRVWLHRVLQIQRTAPKLEGQRWWGPYVVHRILKTDTYLLHRAPEAPGHLVSTTVAHTSRLRPYRPEGALPGHPPPPTPTMGDENHPRLPKHVRMPKTGERWSFPVTFWDPDASPTEAEEVVIVHATRTKIEYIRPSVFDDEDRDAFEVDLPDYLAVYHGRALKGWADFARATRIMTLPNNRMGEIKLLREAS